MVGSCGTLPGRGKGFSVGGSGNERGKDGKVIGGERKTPGMGQ